MCGFLTKDQIHVTDVYFPRDQQQHSHYEASEVCGSSSVPDIQLPHQHSPESPRHGNPPHEHSAASSSDPLGETFCGNSEGARTDSVYSQSSSSGSEKAQKRNDTDSPRARSSTIRLPCSVIRQPSGSGFGKSEQGILPARRTEEAERLSEALKSIVELKEFLASAPTQFGPGEFIRQFRLPSEEQISCVRWKQVFCITGTDIVRSLVFRFSVFGREVTNRKKFEEGVFSDLRNLKINVDATLESPKSELLELLYKHHCVRTKKKQKVFFWYSVQHDQLFIDTLERELKREQAYKAEQNSRALGMSGFEDSYTSFGSPVSTKAVREPALSFKFNGAIPLIEQVTSISKGLPANFATLIDATTTGLNVPGDSSRPTFGTGAMPIPHRSFRNPHGNNPHDHELPYSSHPLTPVPSVDKMSNQELLASPRFQSRQPNTFGTPDSLASLSTPTSTAPLCTSSGSPWAHVGSAYEPQRRLSLEGVETNSPFLRRENFKHETEEDSDFPLDLLVQHDYEHQKSPEDSSFHMKYHDFVYNNRPALSVSSSLAASPFASCPNMAFAGPDWERMGASSETQQLQQQFAEDSHSAAYQQHALPQWRRTGKHDGNNLDPPFEYKPTKNSPLGGRGSGRVMKYSSTNFAAPSLSGSTFTDGY